MKFVWLWYKNGSHLLAKFGIKIGLLFKSHRHIPTQIILEYPSNNDGIVYVYPGSSTSVAGRDRKKQEAGAVFKLFIHKANQRKKLLLCKKCK